MATMNTEPGVREQAPERIYMHPTSAEANVNPWPLEPGEYVEYIRADLAATRMRDKCVGRLKRRVSAYVSSHSKICGLEARNELRAAISEIESLTLDGEKEQ